jgi:MFS family permease
MSKVAPDRQTLFHYAWVIVSVAALIEMVGAGIRAAFGVFIDPLVVEHGWSNSSIALAYALSFVVSAVFAPVAGKMAADLGARKSMAIGGIFFLFGMLGTASISQVWHLYLSYSVGLGIAQSLFLIPALPAVTLWFRRHLGLGTGVLWISWGLGPVIGVQLMSLLITNYGWETSFRVAGVCGTVVILLLLLLFRNSPADAGRKPYGWREGETVSSSSASAPPVHRRRYENHIRGTNAFWNLINLHFLGCVGHSVILVMIVPMAIHEGMSPNAAAGVLSTMVGVSLVTRFGGPILADNIGAKPVMFFAYLGQGLTVLLLLSVDSSLGFFVFAVVFGVAYGGEGTIFPVVNRQYYGMAPQEQVFSWQLLGANLGMALGGLLGAFTFDLTGTYTLAILLSAGFSIAGALAILLLESTKRILIPDWDRESVDWTRAPEVSGAAAIAQSTIRESAGD